MSHANRIRRAIAIPLTLLPLLSGGCVFDHIHEQLVEVNDNMKVTQDILRDANTTLSAVHQQLDEVQKTNELLVQLQAGLGTDEAMDTKTENRLSIIATMESIDRSLAKMDEHMTALRKTISNIDNTIPFLNLGGGSDTEEAETEATEGASSPPPEGDAGAMPSNPEGGDAPKGDAPKRD